LRDQETEGHTLRVTELTLRLMRAAGSTAEELVQHPVFALKLRSPIDYLQPALDIPYCYHEK
jgi:putative two-component system response regulator